MTKPTFESLPRAKRRGLFTRALLRPVLISTCLVAAYYALPMDQSLSVPVGVSLVLGLLLVSALTAYQARAIVRSPYPRVRAIEALAMSLPLFLLLFATVYFKMGRNQPGTFTQPMSRTDALYFTVTVFSTVGFGDITPATETARVVTMVQMLGDLFLVGVAARVILGAVQVGLQRGGRAPETDQPPQTH